MEFDKRIEILYSNFKYFSILILVSILARYPKLPIPSEKKSCQFKKKKEINLKLSITLPKFFDLKKIMCWLELQTHT